MSLVTCCPACATSFLVKPEQLAAHRGDVRCGKCSHVFNALDRLGEAPEEAYPAPASVEPAVPIETAPVTPQSETIIVPPPPPAPKYVEDVASRAKLKSVRKHSSFKWALLAGAVLLMLAALLQAIYFLRTPIATKWPTLKPYLVQACDFANCTVELTRDADQLMIDDSDIQEDAEHQGVIRLSSTLINRAPFPQAYPLLELTLTDSEDKPMLRRSFSPAEYVPAGTIIDEGIAAGEEIHINLTLSANDEAIAGYRIFITYPNN